MEELLKALEEKRHSLNLSIRRMADHIGVDDTTLTIFLNGGRPASSNLLANIAIKFPDLELLVLEALKEKHSENG